MKKWMFWTGIVLLVLFEIANVYFIMPLPYSQRVRSIDLAYGLYRVRWFVRALAAVLVVAGAVPVLRASRWRRVAAGAVVAAACAVVYVTNVAMTADHIFIAPTSIRMLPAARNVVDPERLVVGIEVQGESRAYPIQFIGYHHQVRDSIAGRPILVTFCTVCRTGRVLDPVIDGREEHFRLVGMDHFNAMFEDATTGSWWRQATGGAIAGPRKGQTMRELESQQVKLREWLALHPTSLIMQPDSALADRYSRSFDYETGASRSTLTGTDTSSWQDKSWVVGIEIGDDAVAYDWNQLRRESVINDLVGTTPVVLALGADGASFVAYARPDSVVRYALRGDSLVGGGHAYDLSGRGADGNLRVVNASQEFWHSWRTFHPQTRRH